jgi:amino acid transporter
VARKVAPAPPRRTLGTFAGVFTPSVLTILGIILFLRLGFVVGNAGLGRALLIVGLANAISVLTSISLSAIATNLRVKGGGDYYLISRTLGVEFGGAIGVVLFLAQSVSIAFYCIGFGEAVAGFVPPGAPVSPQVVAAGAVGFLFVFAWLGADWATRFQYGVMATLAAALVSFFVGGIARWDAAILGGNWSPPPGSLGFWPVFAIFFPAVTGFTQGVSMSGDLEDPGRSLPAGTFLAVGVSILVYFGATLLLAAALPAHELIRDYGSMKRLSAVGFLIDAGVVAATLSSAMASFLGAPRILQSTAKDRIFPFLAFFAVGTGPSDNPRRGVLLCTGIALGTIALGNLNLVARVVSMFFLISYGLLNYATYYEARSRSHSFRPRFRWFHARLSLAGGLVCLASMLALDVAAGLTAIAVLAAIHQYLRRTAGPARWADSRRSYHLQQVREHLLAAAAEPQHPRDWRPNLLAFSNDADRRRPLLRFGSWIEGGSGLTTAVRVVEGEGVRVLRERASVEDRLGQDLREGGFQAFPLAVAAPSLEVGIQLLVQACGAGPLRANTALLNWLEERPDPEAGRRYGRNLRATFRLGLNLVILDAKPEEWDELETHEPHGRRIDVWWQDDATSRLMLLLAYLITRSDDWDGAAIRVLAAAGDQSEEARLETLRQTLDEARIEGEPLVTAPWSPDLVAEHSGGSSLVFLPLRLRGESLLGPSGEPVDAFLDGLPIVALVIAAHDIDLGAEPEEGVAGDRAAALDALGAAREKARTAGEEAARAAAEAEGRLRAMRTAVASGLDEETVARLEAETLEALEESRKAARREARAVAKAEQTAREAAALGVRLEEEAAAAPQGPEEGTVPATASSETGGEPG